jgi:hypothetical protein
VNNSPTGTVVYAGTQVSSKVVAALTGTVGDTTPLPGSFTTVSVGTNPGGPKFFAKQTSADAYGMVIESSTGDKWLRMGHNGTDAIIETTYSATGPSGNLILRQFGGVGGSAAINTTGLAVTGTLSATTTIRPGGYTVATLPAGTVGMKAYVTDAVAPAFLTLLVGGGAAYSGAQYSGTQWVAD